MSHPLVDDLLALGLPDGDWALFGSGPLLVRGWVDEVGDLDVITRGRALEEAQRMGRPMSLDDGTIIYEVGEGITIGSTWAYGDVDIDRLIDEAEVLDGVPCVRLEHVVAYKREAGRPRDREHLAIIEANT